MLEETRRAAGTWLRTALPKGRSWPNRPLKIRVDFSSYRSILNKMALVTIPMARQLAAPVNTRIQKLLSLLNLVEFRWQGMDDRKMGIGNISLAGGVRFDPHEGHQSGLDVDIRLIRKDGLELGVRWTDDQYDHEATATLINLFFETNRVKVIYFNDPKIARVKPRYKHDNHFHVTILE